MNYVNIIGFTAGTLTTIAFVPQAIKIWKTKSAKDISLGMFVILCTGISLWVIYGILVKSLPLVVANATTLVFALSILVLKIIRG
jgi:MtN3 and saliva related transmembrane protein